MKKAVDNFNIHDWLEKPIKRLPRNNTVSKGPDISMVADAGAGVGYSGAGVALGAPPARFEGAGYSYDVDIEPMLFPQTDVPEYFMDNFKKAGLVSAGISKQSFERFKQMAGLDYNQLADLLGVARNTLINKKGNDVFDVHISEKVLAIAEVYTHGLSVFEDDGAFKHWLGLPNTALGGVAPFSLLGNQFGCLEVHKVLGRIEWGVYS